MDIFWIISILTGFFITNPTNGQSEVEVQLVIKKYVEKGSSVTIYCEHNVKHEILYKVLWLKTDHGKLFEYVRVRNPPFRNFTIPGGEIDWPKSDEGKLTLKNLDFNASGHYYCEVSTDTPIFTKASQDEHLHVILPQSGPPLIKFRKKPPFYIGDKLIALCNTTKARPTPHITWLINGIKVEDKYIRPGQSVGSKSSHRSKSYLVQQQLLLQQQQQQQQQQHHQLQHSPQKHLNFLQLQGQQRGGGAPLIDRQQIQLQPQYENNEKNLKGPNSYGFSWQDELPSQQHMHHHDGHHHSNLNSPFNQPANVNEFNHRNYDNKYYENKKHRNSFNRKYRRYVNEMNGYKRSNGFNGNGTSSIINDNGFHNVAGYGNEGSGGGGGGGGVSGSYTGYSGSSSSSSSSSGAMANFQRYHYQHHNGTTAISQLYIDVAEHHINTNGRIEITCLATIPAHVAVGEQFADYKTHSVKIDVFQRPPNETTDIPPAPNPGGMAQVGSSSSNAISILKLLSINLILICLTISRV